MTENYIENAIQRNQPIFVGWYWIFSLDKSSFYHLNVACCLSFVLSGLLRFTDSDYPFGILKLVCNYIFINIVTSKINKNLTCEKLALEHIRLIGDVICDVIGDSV